MRVLATDATASRRLIGACMATLVIFAVAMSLRPLTTSSAAAAGMDAVTSNGVFTVEVPAGDGWVAVGTAAFGLQYTTQVVSLPGEYDAVRLVHSGGTAAQLDVVALEGNTPGKVLGSRDPLAVAKLAARDDDVTDAFGRALVLEFPKGGSVLEIVARVQGDLSGAFPFEFPVANTFSAVTPGSSFYACDLAALPAVVDTGAEPLVKEPTAPGTGHPSGLMYVWTASDGTSLQVTMDFTSDNTMDGDEDFAAVHVKTDQGLKTFRISEVDRTWGDVAFTYTDKVRYQHKVYEFRIPLAELGSTPGAVGVAFTAYGTAAVVLPGKHSPVISQVYGGGTSMGCTYGYDYIEVHNPAPFPVDVTGWSVQYASAAGTFNSKTDLTGIIPAGGYLLIQEAGWATPALPVTPDIVGGIAMKADSAKVALVNTTVLLRDIPHASLVDLVGYGSAATQWEGSSRVPDLSATTAAFRLDDGNRDTDQNGLDFVVAAPLPRNSGSAPHALSAPADIGLSATTIMDKQPSGTLVGTLSTNDPDSAPPFTYALVAGSGDADNASFSIVGDTLSMAVA
ncbi:MAG: lamin tail domain-containing protein, partial [Coriobacteriia bacterium]|nr:lamin tail domain-containing protein [Coriobacteriia bacterium]